MSQKSFHNLIIECVTGDIVRQPDMDAIVNAANAQLRIGGGVALRTVTAQAPGLVSIRQVRFVLFDADDLRVHAEVLEGLDG